MRMEEFLAGEPVVEVPAEVLEAVIADDVVEVGADAVIDTSVEAVDVPATFEDNSVVVDKDDVVALSGGSAPVLDESVIITK